MYRVVKAFNTALQRFAVDAEVAGEELVGMAERLLDLGHIAPVESAAAPAVKAPKSWLREKANDAGGETQQLPSAL